MEKTRKAFLLVCTLTVVLLVGLAAHAQPDPGEAKEHFKNQNYKFAMPVYKRLVKYEPKNPEYLYRLGQCYLRTNIDKKAAVPYLEKAVALPKCDPEARFDLGLAYSYAYKFDEALKAFKAYREDIGNSGKMAAQVAKAIENCQTAKDLMKYPLDVTFTNMGDHINSKDPDYQPYVAKDGSMFVFTSRRDENRGSGLEFDGYYSSDIWMVESKETGYSKPKSLGSINSSYDEQSVGISDDGATVFAYLDQITKEGRIFGDIFTTTRKGSKYGRKKPLTENVNSKHFESAASLSSDEQTLFFSSNRPGGQGGLDIWMSRKLPTGEWAIPQNLGPEVNTPFDEDYPTLSSDNKTLYFSSSGHPGMGGYDLYRSTWEPELNTWSKPVNLGYPINTPEDNHTISFTYDGKHAFVSALRDEGVGDLDIYKVTYNSVDIRPAIFILMLETGDSINPRPDDAFVTVFDENGEEFGTYIPNPNTKNLIIVLMPGKYDVEIEAEGYKTQTVNWKVTDFHLRQGEIIKIVNLEQ